MQIPGSFHSGSIISLPVGVGRSTSCMYLLVSYVPGTVWQCRMRVLALCGRSVVMRGQREDIMRERERETFGRKTNLAMTTTRLI